MYYTRLDIDYLQLHDLYFNIDLQYQSYLLHIMAWA